jgi:hypothetical protein
MIMSRPLNPTAELWDVACSFLPDNLDELARTTGAISRPRRVESSTQLLRAFLTYASTGSFRTSAALVKSCGLLDITPEGLFYRLSKAESFLTQVLMHLTRGFVSPVGYRLLIVDATSVCGPGATQTDWRVHVGYDPHRGVPASVHVTDGSVGEKVAHHGLGQGCLAVGDRCYGTARNVHHVLEAQADFLVRLTNKQMRLLDANRVRADWDALAAQVPTTGAISFDLELPVPPPGSGPGAAWHERDAIALHPVRLIAARSKKGEVVWLLTNLNAERLSNVKATELYRVRWQVELYFKRLKSIGNLDCLGSRDGPTAKPALLAKLILMVLANLLSEREQAFSPYGYPMPETRAQPMEGIRLHPKKASRRFAAQKTKAANPSDTSQLFGKTQEHILQTS